MKPTQPDVCLLSYGRVKIPCFAVFSKQFRVLDRVAIALAKLVFDRMFAIEVKDINRESHVFEEGVILDVLGKRAIVVEKKMIRLLIIDAESSFYKLLHRIRKLQFF